MWCNNKVFMKLKLMFIYAKDKQSKFAVYKWNYKAIYAKKNRTISKIWKICKIFETKRFTSKLENMLTRLKEKIS